MPAGIICGFRVEQRIAERVSSRTACGWHNPNAAQSLIGRGAECLVSFGLAGALAPGLKTGMIVIPDHVILPNGDVHHCNAALVEILRARFPKAVGGALLASSGIVPTSGAKREQHERTKAVATDMESAAVAKAAATHAMPFCVFRVVADTAADTLPPAAQNGLKADGTTAYGEVLGSILRDPGQVPALVRLALVSRTAMGVLRRSVPELRAALS